MLRILLCDDDPIFMSLENSIIIRMIKDNSLPCAVCCMAGSAAELCAYMQSNPGGCLVFLDIDFGENRLSGIDISALIKSGGEGVKVVFCTNHFEMAMQVLKSGTEPFGFLEKGIDTASLASGLARYIKMALRLENASTDDGDAVILNTGAGERVKIRIGDILWAESEKGISHGITYRTVNGSKITVIGTLNSEAERLGEGFIRVHRSYVASKNHMLALRGGYIVMSDRSEIPCSFQMRGEVKKWLDKK